MKKLLLIPWPGLRRFIVVGLVWPLFTSASYEKPLQLTEGIAHIINGRSHIYFGPEEEKASNELPAYIKEAAAKKEIKAIRFNGHIIIHDPMAYTQAWMLYDSIQDGLTNEYLTAKLLGGSDDAIRGFYKHLRYTSKEYRDDKKQAKEWLAKWKNRGDRVHDGSGKGK